VRQQINAHGHYSFPLPEPAATGERCGMVLVVEHVVGVEPCHLENEGPGTVKAPGPKGYGTNYTICRPESRLVVSTPALYQGSGARIA
jgi:hypothetical protein